MLIYFGRWEGFMEHKCPRPRHNLTQGNKAIVPSHAENALAL